VSSPRPDRADVAFAGVGGQRRMLGDGTLTAPELMSICLERMALVNPRLNAFTAVRAEAALKDEAAGAQRAIDAGDDRPLLGIPFAVKDDLDVAGLPTSYGTARSDGAAPTDSELVGTLRAAGAIPVGKTTLPELGTHAFTASVAWGPTRNPWDPSRTPGGSSGGSAAAVAAGLVPFATGGDGGGSIRIPAACCSLFGLKLGGHAPELTVHGVLARTVEDTALLYDVIRGDDLLTAALAQEPERLRIGVTWRLGLPARVAGEVRRLVEGMTTVLTELGHHVVPLKVKPGNWGVPFSVLGLRLLQSQALPIERPSGLEPSTRAGLRVAGVVPDRLVEWARGQQRRITARVTPVYDSLDVVVTPTMSVPPPEIQPWSGKGLLRDGLRMSRYYPFTSLWNFVALPAANVPVGLTPAGLPVGGQLLGGPGSEETLVRLSMQLEAALGWPRLRPPGSSA
jgi:amidase